MMLGTVYDARACPAAQIGAVLLTAQHAGTERGQTIFYIIAQFVFGRAVHLTRFIICILQINLVVFSKYFRSQRTKL